MKAYDLGVPPSELGAVCPRDSQTDPMCTVIIILIIILREASQDADCTPHS